MTYFKMFSSHLSLQNTSYLLHVAYVLHAMPCSMSVGIVGRVSLRVIPRPVSPFSLFAVFFSSSSPSGVPKEENDRRLSQPTASLDEPTIFEEYIHQSKAQGKLQFDKIAMQQP